MSIAASLVLLLLAGLAYRRHLGRNESRLLLGLRLLVLALLLLILTSQVFRYSWIERPRRVVVLRDVSASMSAVGADSAAAQLARSLPLPEQVRREEWWFAGAAGRGSLPDAGVDTMRSLLGEALQAVFRTRPGAVILLSDGQNNGEVDPVAAAREAGVPIYAVGFGSTMPGNAAVTRIELPGTVYAGDTVIATVRLFSSGLSPVPASVRLKGQSVLFAPSQEPGEQEVQFRLRFDSAGPQVMEAVVESLPAEASYADNRRTVAVDVKPGRVSVAYLSNRPGFSTRFILSALRALSRLEVLPAVQMGLTARVERPKSAQVYLLDACAETGEWVGLLAEVERRVRAGAGAMILAGPGFSPGEVMNRMLPVVLSGGHGSRAGQADRAAPDSGTFTPAATTQARLLSWLSPEAGIDLSAVPPFRLVWTGELKPNARSVWLECAENGTPLLVAGKLGRGKVVYLAAYPLWRWGFGAEQKLQTNSALAILLKGVVQYLTEADTARFVLESDRPAYLTGEPVRLTLTARAEDGAVMTGLEPSVSVDGLVKVPMIEVGQGRYEAVLQCGPGQKRATVEVRAGDTIVGRAVAQFVVAEQSVELSQLGLNAGLLRSVAAASGGAYYPSESLPRDGCSLRTGSFVRRLVLDWRRSVWPYLLAGLLAAVELWLRRRKGLP